MPSDIRPLRPSGRFTDVQKPHESDLCQKCIELGHNCRNYVPPKDDPDTVDFPDDQSIISEASTASSSSFAEDQQLSDQDLTPVCSDEEEADRFLEDKLKSMHLK